MTLCWESSQHIMVSLGTWLQKRKLLQCKFWRMKDAATGDDLDFKNSQELLIYMTKMNKNDLNLN